MNRKTRNGARYRNRRRDHHHNNPLPATGTAAAVVYGAVQIKSGIDGEDWGTHRKLSQEERTGNFILAD